MWGLTGHYKKWGRGMGYGGKKDYDAAAKEFANIHQTNPKASIIEGNFLGSGKGQNAGKLQRAISYEGNTVVLDVNSGQVMDFIQHYLEALKDL